MSQDVQFVLELEIEAPEAFKECAKAAAALVEASEPTTIAYRWFLNPDETKCYIIEWYPNADVIPAHLALVGPTLGEMLKVAQITRFEVFGDVTGAAKAALEGAGAAIFPAWIGFTR
jgi:hypothetical protein